MSPRQLVNDALPQQNRTRRSASSPRMRLQALGLGVAVLAGCQADTAVTPNAAPIHATTALVAQPGLRAEAGTSVKAAVTGDVDAVSGSVVRSGTRGYFFGIKNQGTTPVTTATVTMVSGWGLNFFPGISALPAVGGPVTLAPGQSLDNIFFGSLCCTLVPSSFAPGFDSQRSVNPTRIGAGGATQTVRVTVKLTDLALWEAGFFGFSVAVSPNFSGVTLVSASGPSNLDEGETVAPGGGPPTSIVSWHLAGARFSKEYTFTATLQVPNPFGFPIDSKPSLHLVAVPFATSSTTGPLTSVFVPKPSLDGSTPGFGGVTFAVDQAETWQVVTNETRELDYKSLLRRAPNEDITAPVTTINSVVDGNGATIAGGGSTLSGSIAFTFSGTDAVGVVGFRCSFDAAPYVTCSSAATYSGLAVGPHAFGVRALDAAGNIATPATFAWSVVTPAQAVQDLIGAIAAMGLPVGVANSLSAPLNNFNPSNLTAACGKLDAFINQVNAKLQNGQLTPAIAAQLLQAANAIKASLGCV